MVPLKLLLSSWLQNKENESTKKLEKRYLSNYIVEKWQFRNDNLVQDKKQNIKKTNSIFLYGKTFMW